MSTIDWAVTRWQTLVVSLSAILTLSVPASEEYSASLGCYSGGSGGGGGGYCTATAAVGPLAVGLAADPTKTCWPPQARRHALVSRQRI